MDGSYIIGAKAFDATGIYGPTQSMTMVLNRRVPYAPTGAVGGHNAFVVDFEWLRNKERDIAGYRVYRTQSGGPDVQVCQVVVTNCQDSTPPAGSPLTYYVVALDHNPGSGALREGDHSSTISVTTGNTAPNAPTNLTASPSGPNTVLLWSAPNPTDADGESIAFYRIYRDGQSFADRYDRTQSAAVTYTDTNTGGMVHTYWITAVDPQEAESTLVGSVTQ